MLDALGLPRGIINLDQNIELASQTTLRAGDSFQIAIQGTAARTATISIDPGETLDSLASKINAQLGSLGKASINYGATSEGLKIAVNAGTTLKLVAGPNNFDALARLGISPGVLSAPATGAAATAAAAAAAATSKATLPTYGLGLTGTVLGPLDISTSTGASLTRSTLLTVLSNIQKTFQTSNTPVSTATTVGNTTGTASAYTTSQLASYNVALGLMNADPSNAVANIQQILNSSGG